MGPFRTGLGLVRVAESTLTAVVYHHLGLFILWTIAPSILAPHKLLRRVQFHYTPTHASWLNTWPRSKSAFSLDSVGLDASPTRTSWPARWPLGSAIATFTGKPCSGLSHGRMRIASWAGTMLRN
jgi:hypothetical protein